MYIQPNTDVRLLRNAKPDPDYTNTLTFANASAQSSYFQGLTKYTFSAQTYQRVNKKVIRVNRKADDLYDVNYMMFKNSAYGSKWFYAFVTKIEYINDVTSEVHYSIDVMQTWYFDWFPNECFVEREHSATDEIGDNILPEPIETGEIIMNSYERLMANLDLFCIIVAVCDISTPDGQMCEGVFSGAELHLFTATSTGASAINTFLSGYQQKPDAIIGMYLVPELIVGHPSTEGEIIASKTTATITSKSLSKLVPPLTMGGYQPKNRKLYTYPYNYLHVDNANGNSLALRYEFFDDLTPTFDIIGTATQPVEVSLRPTKYKGSQNHASGLSDCYNAENISLKGFPICSWNMDSWKAWVAQNSLPLTMNSAVSLAGIMNNTANAASGGLAKVLAGDMGGGSDVEGALSSGAINTLALASNILTQIYKASIQADMYKGSLNNGGTNCASRKQNFFVGRASVTGQMARIIDSFFDRFGYACNRVKTPNYKGRPYWNYVKTLDSNVSGSIPADDKMKIDAIFNKGITFWHDPAHFEDYNLNNTPITP